MPFTIPESWSIFAVTTTWSPTQKETVSGISNDLAQRADLSLDLEIGYSILYDSFLAPELISFSDSNLLILSTSKFRG